MVGGVGAAVMVTGADVPDGALVRLAELVAVTVNV
jgi:hypothetical protein